MTALIAIFHDETDLSAAMDALEEFGIDDGSLTVLGGAGFEQAPEPGGAGPAVLPGAAPESRNAGVAVDPEHVPPPIAAAVSEQLGDLVDGDEQLHYYASVLAHDGRLLALSVDDERSPEVLGLLRNAGASHVDRGDD